MIFFSNFYFIILFLLEDMLNYHNAEMYICFFEEVI